MELLLLLIQIPLLVFLIRYIRRQHSDPVLVNSYYYLLSVKVTFGLLLGVIYTNYYKGGDTVFYHQCLEELSQLLSRDFKAYYELIFHDVLPSGLVYNRDLLYSPRAFFFIKILSPLYIITGNDYWMLAIYLSVFAFAGLWMLSDTLIRLYKLNSLAVMISFFLFPSVVFWASGVMKESLIIGVMGFLISIALNSAYGTSRLSWVKIILMLVFAWVLFQIKFYYFAALFAVLFPYCCVTVLARRVEAFKQKSYRICALLGGIGLVGMLAFFLFPLLHQGGITSLLYYNYIATLQISEVQNSYRFDGLSTEAMSFLPHIPTALSYGLFGPYLWQNHKLISLLAGVENTFLLTLFSTFVLSNFKKEKFAQIELEEISVALYVFFLAVSMAFASPNWGSLVRYKIGYLPFFLLLILNRNPFITQLETRFQFLKRAEKKSIAPVQSK